MLAFCSDRTTLCPPERSIEGSLALWVPAGVGRGGCSGRRSFDEDTWGFLPPVPSLGDLLLESHSSCLSRSSYLTLSFQDPVTRDLSALQTYGM